MSFFDYFQIAIIVIFIAIVVTKAVYLRISRNITAIVAGRDSRGLARVFEIAAFAGLVFWMVEIVLYALHSHARVLPAVLHDQFFESFALRVAGVILISGGLVVFILAFFNFGDSWRVGVDYETPGALVTRGIFSLTRNPIYVFINAWFIGTFLINGTWIFLVLAVLAIAAQHWQILREEEFLKKSYGEAYERYRNKVPRYLIW
ncbi:MAG TPA: isoprenylcysteine carboxylmethyltransferase family protein [Pyrinomonadaceae bacterium]|nr:isoprenylcysteine carboxylmethyltransferase family protein [Pyrinomonadaceae bacterium]